MTLALQSSRPPKAPRVMVYGTHGVGKSTLACAAPSPVAIDLEDGLGELNIPTFGVLRTFGDVENAIKQLFSEEHTYKTVVLDTLDALEWLVWQRTCKAKGWPSIEAPGYGKGYVEALETWRYILDGLDALREQRGMAIIMTAHAEIRRFDSPETEPFERYQPKLQARASALVQECVDAVLFAGYKVNIMKSDVGFNRKVARIRKRRTTYLGNRTSSRRGEESLWHAGRAAARLGGPECRDPAVQHEVGSLNMAQLNFNAEDVAPGGSFEPVPAGNYPCQIIASEMKDTRAGNGKYLVLTLEIIGGEFAGRKVFDRLNLENENAAAVDIARRTLSAICHAAGVLQLTDSEELHFKPMTVGVRVRPPGPDKFGVERDAQNEVRKYNRIDATTSAGFVPPKGASATAPAWGRA